MKWNPLKKPVIEIDKLCDYIIKKTGINKEIVIKVLDTEEDYLKLKKIIR